MNKKLIFALIGAAIVAVLLIVAKKKGWIGQPDAKKVTVEKVEKRDITETVTASGKIQPEAEVTISPDVAGKIIELPVKEGDKVNEGQLLVKINPDIYEATVKRLEASLNTAKANLSNSQARLQQVKAQFDNAEASYNRNKQLYEEKTISKSDYDAALSSFKTADGEVDAAIQSVRAAEFNVKSAEAGLQEAKDNLSKATIYSPVSGTISKLNFEVGETVVGTQQMMGSEIMTIANLNEMEVQVEVNENDIIRVGFGDSVLIEVDAYLDREFKGIVTSIANSANITGTSLDEVTNFEVKIRMIKESYADINNEKQPGFSPFRPGMSASVEIQTKTVRNALSVPLQAVTTRDAKLMEKDEKEKGKRKGPPKDEDESEEGPEFEETEDKSTGKEKIEECVFVLKNGKAIKRVVTTGIQNTEFIAVETGLEEGEEVITGPYSLVSKILKDGDEVQQVSERVLYESMSDN